MISVVQYARYPEAQEHNPIQDAQTPLGAQRKSPVQVACACASVCPVLRALARGGGTGVGGKEWWGVGGGRNLRLQHAPPS